MRQRWFIEQKKQHVASWRAGGLNRYVRPQHGCTCCQRVVSGDMPAHIIQKGVAEPSLIARQVISKHCDHMPPYRQQPVLARPDIHLPVSTMPIWSGVRGQR